MQIISTNLHWLILLIALFNLLLVAAILFAKPILRYTVNRITNSALKRLLSDEYDQNLVELLPSLKRFSVLNLIELSLRAEKGSFITRPLGSPRNFIGFDNLMFTPQQMTALPLSENVKIDMSVTIGATAEKPLKIDIPLMIGGMAYGTALSEEAKLALARASKTLKTANCSGEGPFLASEAKESGKFILQICCWPWGARTSEQISTADMLEIKMGQGADVGPSIIEAKDIEGKARLLAGLAPDESAVGLPGPPGVQKTEDWPVFMKKLRKQAKGIPLALKIMATDNLEAELSVALTLGFDAVVICGCGGGAHAISPIKQDDFGIPSLHALARAKRFLKNSRVSLIVDGGFFTPGQCLKAFALGADAIYLGTVPLFALGHNQMAKVLPWEPPTTLVYYNSPSKTQLNVDQAATSVANVLTSMVDEMKDAMRALGKSSLKDLSPDDLVALDSVTAEITGVKQAHQAKLMYEEKHLRETLNQLNKQLRYARRLTVFLDTALEEMHSRPKLSESHQLKHQYIALRKLKSSLDV